MVTKLWLSSLKSGGGQKYALSPFLFNIGLDVLARAIQKEKEIKDVQTGMEEVRLFFFSDGMTVDVKDLNPPPENS